jgi:hypothetical protein
MEVSWKSVESILSSIRCNNLHHRYRYNAQFLGMARRLRPRRHRRTLGLYIALQIDIWCEYKGHANCRLIASLRTKGANFPIIELLSAANINPNVVCDTRLLLFSVKFRLEVYARGSIAPAGRACALKCMTEMWSVR